MSVAALPGAPASPAAPDTADLVAELAAVSAELGDAGADEPEAEAAPERGADGKFKAKAEAAPEKPEEERAEGRPTTQERFKFREKQRQLKAREAAVQAENAQLRAEYQRITAELESASPAKLRAMLDNADADGIARALGRKSWSEVNDHLVRAFADPGFRQNQELKARVAAIEAEKQAALEQHQQRLSHEQRVAAEKEAVVQITEVLSGSQIGELVALSEDPDFATAVMRRCVHNGDDDIESAAQEIADEARARFSVWLKAFGGQPSAKAETGRPVVTSRAVTSKTPVRPNKHVNRSQATEASPQLDDDLTDEQWLALAHKEMRSAAAQERQQSKR